MGWLSKAVKKVKKAVKKVGNEIARPFESIGKEVQRGAAKAFGIEKPEIPESTPGAQATPDAEQTTQDMSTPENISRRKRNRRNGLRIDLNTGGTPAGNGVNLPVG